MKPFELKLERFDLSQSLVDWINYLAILKINPSFRVKLDPKDLKVRSSSKGNLMILLNGKKSSITLLTTLPKAILSKLKLVEKDLSKTFELAFGLNLDLSRKSGFWYGNLTDFQIIEKNIN